MQLLMPLRRKDDKLLSFIITNICHRLFTDTAPQILPIMWRQCWWDYPFSLLGGLSGRLAAISHIRGLRRWLGWIAKFLFLTPRVGPGSDWPHPQDASWKPRNPLNRLPQLPHMPLGVGREAINGRDFNERKRFERLDAASASNLWRIVKKNGALI
jgi:hypothetical protein